MPKMPKVDLKSLPLKKRFGRSPSVASSPSRTIDSEDQDSPPSPLFISNGLGPYQQYGQWGSLLRPAVIPFRPFEFFGPPSVASLDRGSSPDSNLSHSTSTFGSYLSEPSKDHMEHIRFFDLQRGLGLRSSSPTGSLSSASTSSPSFGHYKCQECFKSFSNENSLRLHARRHLNKKMGRYRCDICGQTFSQRSGQVNHIRVHTKEKPFECEVCQRHFSDFSTFTKHKRVHTGEKPYSCPICRKTFSQSGNMHRHIRAIHEGLKGNSFQEQYPA